MISVHLCHQVCDALCGSEFSEEETRSFGKSMQLLKVSNVCSTYTKIEIVQKSFLMLYTECLCPPNFYIEIPTLNVIVLGDGGLWEVIRL